MGMTQLEMRTTLAECNNVIISERQLQRYLHEISDIGDVVNVIERQLDTSGRQCGYWFLHQKCLRNGLVVPRETVREILLVWILGEWLYGGRDALQGGATRGKGETLCGIGPINCYDKLKPFGLGIGLSGCIDHCWWLFPIDRVVGSE